MNELVELDKINAIEVFTGQGLDPLLEKIHAIVDAFKADTSTVGGRAEIASLAHKVARSKTFLDEQGKTLVGDWKSKSKAVDVERKRMRDDLDALKERARRPLTEYEEVERGRIEVHELRIKGIWDTANQMPLEWDSLPLDEMRQHLVWVEAVPMGDEHWEEFAGKAAEAKDAALAATRTAIEKRETLDAERAEVERLRQEAEERRAEEARQAVEREAKEREEQARREGEEKARKEAEEQRLAAEKAKEEAESRAAQAGVEAKAAAEKAEQDRIAAAEQATRNEELAARRERDQIEAEKREAEEAARKREADQKHKKSVDGSAVLTLENLGVSKKAAEKVISVIAAGLVPNVRITY